MAPCTWRQDNHRVQHLAPDGTSCRCGASTRRRPGDGPGRDLQRALGRSRRPGRDVFVADTWNHRIQHFSARGDFIDMWGTFGQGQQPDALWGRAAWRGRRGRVYVADTATSAWWSSTAGAYPAQFGSAGRRRAIRRTGGIDVDPGGRSTWPTPGTGRASLRPAGHGRRARPFGSCALGGGRLVRAVPGEQALPGGRPAPGDCAAQHHEGPACWPRRHGGLLQGWEQDLGPARRPAVAGTARVGQRCPREVCCASAPALSGDEESTAGFTGIHLSKKKEGIWPAIGPAGPVEEPGC
jgi:hypothetical protein